MICNCRQFLLGLKKYGKGDWRNISRNFVTTRTPTQVASHAQKYFIRQLTGGKDKRRSSIHDITTVNVPDSKSPSPDIKRSSSPDQSAAIMQPMQQPQINAMVKQPYDCWKPSNEGLPVVFNPTNGNALIGPFCGISSYGSKLQEQNFLSGNLRGSQFGPYSSTLYQMQSMHHQWKRIRAAEEVFPSSEYILGPGTLFFGGWTLTIHAIHVVSVNIFNEDLELVLLAIRPLWRHLLVHIPISYSNCEPLIHKSEKLI